MTVAVSKSGHSRNAPNCHAAARAARLYADIGDDEQRFRCLSTQVAIGARRGVGREIDEAIDEARKIVSPHTIVRLYFGWAEYRWLQARGVAMTRCAARSISVELHAKQDCTHASSR